jgi:hypothetical protein
MEQSKLCAHKEEEEEKRDSKTLVKTILSFEVPKKWSNLSYVHTKKKKKKRKEKRGSSAAQTSSQNKNTTNYIT